MKSRILLALAAAATVIWLALATLVGPGVSTRPAYATGVFNYNFNYGLESWQGFADGGVDEYYFTHETDDDGCLATNISGYANLRLVQTTAGRAGLWMERTFSETGPLSVTVTWKVTDKNGNAVGMNSIAYIGSSQPTALSSFTIVDSITDDWKTNTYTKTLTTSGTLYVDLGWKPPLDNYDPVEVGIDCVTVDVQANSQ